MYNNNEHIITSQNGYDKMSTLTDFVLIAEFAVRDLDVTTIIIECIIIFFIITRPVWSTVRKTYLLSA